MKNKKFIKDFVLNVIAYAVPVFINQIIIQPILGSKLESDIYGEILTLINLINLVPFTIGNTLNNIRLIQAHEYCDKNANGDFPIFLIMGAGLTFFLSVMGFNYFSGSINIIELVLFILLSLLWFLREYYIVVFRLAIDFKNILINNLLLGIGYICGLLFFIYGFFGTFWELIFITGQFISMLYILSKGKYIFREPIVKTKLYSTTLNMILILLAANFLSVGLGNVDKLLIQPVLGNTSVSIYHAASVFTKIVSTCTAPIAMVILSYLSKKKSIERKNINLTIKIGMLVALLGYVFCISSGRFFINILYPTYLEDALNYIWITSLNTMLALIISMLRPFTMKFCDLKWQIVIGVLSNLGYFLFVLLFIKTHEIWSVCIGYSISLIIQLMLYLFITYNQVKKTDYL